MKKLFSIMLAAICMISAFAQTQGTRKLRAWHEGVVIWQLDAAKIDSLNFFIDTNNSGSEGDNEGTGGDVTVDSAQIYVGVVAFNKSVNQLPITSDVEAAKTFITNQTNDQDFTAFAYSVSKGSKLFDAKDLPAFDKVFMLNFSDGTDNYSNMLWGMEGRMVKQANVYDTVQYDLAQCAGLNSYAIGFGDDAGFGEKMQKVVRGSGTYRNAETSADLQSTFTEIAQSILASAKNVVLTTNPGFYSEDMGYKYFRFTFVAEGGLKDTIYAKMDGTPFEGFTLSITKAGQYAQFDAPVQGTFDEETGKVSLPLNNLKFVSNGEELQYNFEPYVSFDGELYYEDVEEASTAEDISKRIAVVLVLDCSKSMGDAFTPMKEAAIDFIETLESMDTEAGSGSIPMGDNISVTANGVSFNMKRVEGGTFTMGATSEQGTSDPYDDEYPTHQVTLSDYYIGETEVTQALWYAVMGYKPTSGGNQWTSSYGLGDNYPAYYISWDDCQSFITKLNALTGKTFRMPTEAEWEYAARGGNKSKGYKYSGSNTIGDVAWYSGNNGSSGTATYGSKQVGTKAANELGIYDMSGNVYEWCSDWFGDYSSSAQTNPTGASSGSVRVLRGGSWSNSAGSCRVSYRSSRTPSSRYNNIGLRLVLVP